MKIIVTLIRYAWKGSVKLTLHIYSLRIMLCSTESEKGLKNLSFKF